MAIARVQVAGNQNGSGNTTLVVTIAASGTGNLLVVGIFVPAGATTISSVTDNKAGGSSTYTKDVDVLLGGTRRLNVWSTPNSASGITTITITPSAQAILLGIVAEYSGIATSTPFDVTASQQQVGVTSWDSTTATTNQADELLFGLASNGGGFTVTYTAGTNWTNTKAVDDTADGDSCDSFERIVSATGSYSANGTNSPSATVNSLIATYKAPAAAAAGGPTFDHYYRNLRGWG